MIELNAQNRQITGKAVGKLRLENLIPGVIYGRVFNNQNISLNYAQFEHVYQQGGESSLINLKINGQPAMKVVIADVQTHPLSGRFIHVDFHKVRMDEKIKAEVQLELIGESPAVKDWSGVLVKALDKVEIECLPIDLINKIEVDISSLKSFADVIRVSDLSVPDKVEILTPLDTALVLVEEPKKVKEEKPKEEEKKEEEKVVDEAK